MKSYIIVLLAICFGCGTGIVQERENMGEKRMFVITSTYGTVREAETKVLGEVEAEDAASALKSYMTGLAATWEIHDSTLSEDYAVLENPTSFISDMVDNILARRGRLKRNEKGEMEFHVSLDNWEMGMEKRVVKEWTVWAESVESAANTCVLSEHGELEKTAEDEHGYFAQYACSDPNLFYTVNVMIDTAQ